MSVGHLNVTDKAIKFYSRTFDKILIAEDFNAQVIDIKVDTFCSIWKLKSSKKDTMCFKNPNNPSCVDLFVTNTIRSLQETQVFETGLSDTQKLVVTVLKFNIPKSPSKLITYKSYKNFSNDLLRDDLNSLLRKENMNLEITNLTSFTKIFVEILNKHALIKKNFICETHANFATKDLRKAIVLRSRLQNIFLEENFYSLNRLTTNNRIFALVWLRKQRQNTFKTLTY